MLLAYDVESGRLFVKERVFNARHCRHLVWIEILHFDHFVVAFAIVEGIRLLREVF